jgi:elongation factor Tu
VLAKPGTLSAHKKFEAEIYALTKEEGGRHTPFMSKYAPQFFFRTANITGTVILEGDRQMVMPGDNCKVVCELLTPVALNEGMRFAFREGGRCAQFAMRAHARARATAR